MPEYYYWDGLEETAAGCGLGGTVAFIPTDLGYDYRFADCGLADGLVITGSGAYAVDDDVFSLDITNGEGCAYLYERAGDEVDLDDQCPTDQFGA
jgi:hypothetical protein